MKSLEILVFDDVNEVAMTWVRRIADACEGANVDLVGQDDFQCLLQLINERRRASRENCVGMNSSHRVDKADVVVIDYDLLKYSDSADTTGTRLAYLIRCFSTCGFIIVLNQFGPNVFELGLGSPTEAFADIHVGDVQLENPGLWGAPFDGYRPWYWPVIPDAIENFEKCVNDVHESPDAPILEFLGLDSAVHWLPRRAQEFLEGRRQVDQVTFSDFVEHPYRGVSTMDQLPCGQMARVAASRIIALLNSIILPEQSILVDAPHLVSRYPGLLKSGIDHMDTWNRLCDPANQELDELLDEPLKKHRFAKSHWIWRPAWHWSAIANDESIEEVQDPREKTDVDWEFCEDLSRFVPIECAVSFRALVSPPFIRRYRCRRDSQVAYRHIKQLGSGGALDPLEVDYVPQAVLSS